MILYGGSLVQRTLLHYIMCNTLTMQVHGGVCKISAVHINTFQHFLSLSLSLYAHKCNTHFKLTETEIKQFFAIAARNLSTTETSFFHFQREIDVQPFPLITTATLI